MPKLPDRDPNKKRKFKGKRKPKPEPPPPETNGDAWEAFLREDWMESAKGNGWKDYELENGDIVTVTVFSQKGFYRWCCASPDGRQDYAKRGFDSEEEAMENLGEFLGVGE